MPRTFLAVVAAGSWALGCGSPSGPVDAGNVPPDAGQTSPNSVGLWVDGLSAYTAAELTTSGSPGPADTCSNPENGASSAPAAFDAEGNLWAQQVGESTLSVVLWTQAQLLQACAPPQPSRTVTLNQQGLLADLDQISSMAFDAAGTLWLSFADDAVLLGLSAEQLLQSATVVPTYLVGSGATGAASLYAPTGLAFDAAGNLWVANVFSVLQYKPQTLALALTTSGGAAVAPAPDAFLSTAASEAAAENGGPGTAPTFEYVAFDAAGNLWVSGSLDVTGTATDDISEYAASDLAALSSSSTPPPVVTLPESAAQASGSVSFGALAFDSAGNLWLGAGTQLFRYPAASLAAGGSGAYDVVLSGIPFLTGLSLAFNPIPQGLPIRP